MITNRRKMRCCSSISLLIILSFWLSLNCRRSFAVIFTNAAGQHSSVQQTQDRESERIAVGSMAEECDGLKFTFNAMIMDFYEGSTTCQQRCQRRLDPFKKMLQVASLDDCQATKSVIVRLMESKTLEEMAAAMPNKWGQDPSTSGCATHRDNDACRMKLPGCICVFDIYFVALKSEWLQDIFEVPPGHAPVSAAEELQYLLYCTWDDTRRRLEQRLHPYFQSVMAEPFTKTSWKETCAELNRSLMDQADCIQTLALPGPGDSSFQLYVTYMRSRWKDYLSGLEGHSGDSTDVASSSSGLHQQYVTPFELPWGQAGDWTIEAACPRNPAGDYGSRGIIRGSRTPGEPATKWPRYNDFSQLGHGPIECEPLELDNGFASWIDHYETLHQGREAQQREAMRIDHAYHFTGGDTRMRQKPIVLANAAGSSDAAHMPPTDAERESQQMGDPEQQWLKFLNDHAANGPGPFS